MEEKPFTASDRFFLESASSIVEMSQFFVLSFREDPTRVMQIDKRPESNTHHRLTSSSAWRNSTTLLRVTLLRVTRRYRRRLFAKKPHNRGRCESCPSTWRVFFLACKFLLRKREAWGVHPREKKITRRMAFTGRIITRVTRRNGRMAREDLSLSIANERYFVAAWGYEYPSQSKRF